MSKFKVGDKVVRHTDSIGYLMKGKPYCVVAEVDGKYIAVEGNREGCGWDEDYFELYQEPAQKTFNPASSNNLVSISQQPQDLSFQVKALELENQLLRKLLRREGVEV